MQGNAMGAPGCRLSRARDGSVEHGKMTAMIPQQTAPEFDWILARGVRQFVDEALLEEGIVRMTHRAPVPERYRCRHDDVGNPLAWEFVEQVEFAFDRR